MKKAKRKLFVAVALVALASLDSQLSRCLAQPTGFTYQGRLDIGSSPANGTYDLTIAVFDAPNGGTQQGNTITNAATAVANGLLSLRLDFGNQFPGAPRWLEIAVRTNGTGPFVILSPRQEVNSAPYAIYSGNAAQLGGQAANAYVAKTGDTMSGQLNLPGAGLAVGVAQLVASSGGNVGIGTAVPSETLEINGTSRVDDNDLYFRTAGDRNHGLGYRQSVESIFFDGPYLYGFNGGALGTSNPETVTLKWYYDGTVWISNNCSVATLTARQGANFSGNVGIGTGSPAAALDVEGNDGSGSFNAPLVLLQNANTSASAAPALRVVGWGNTPYGALSVSANGTGLIAQFGNYNAFVADIQTNGTVDALAFNPTSDRSTKENFSPIDPLTVLGKVLALPISAWNYKVAPEVRHVGPMAQDFYSAFGVGSDDRHIATVDADGVALAAIQGLNHKLEEKESEIHELRLRLEKLEILLAQKANQER